MPKLPSIYKDKALRLVLPELAQRFDIPAESPVFISPYVSAQGRCSMCHSHYSPLLYQIGHETVAQHFCKKNGGGIYVRRIEDHSKQWIYNNNLWHVRVLPRDPIYMFDGGHGFTYKSVTPRMFHTPICYQCGQPTVQGSIISCNSVLMPLCKSCNDFGDLPYNNYISRDSTDWGFVYDGTEVRFTRTMPSIPPVFTRAYTN